MPEYTVEFQDQDTILWSFTVEAESEREAATQVIHDEVPFDDLTGIHAYVFKTSNSISDSTIFDADNLQ